MKPATAIVSLCCATVAALFIATYWLIFSCPYPITYEGITLFAASQLSQGANIYDPARLKAAPWVVDIYPPLMAALGAAFPQPVSALLQWLRAIALAGFAGTIVGAYRLLLAMGVYRPCAAAALLLFATSIPAWFMSAVAKPDYLCLALEISAWLVFWLNRQARGQRQGADDCERYALAAGLSVLAMLAKQQGVVAPITIVLFLVCRRQWRSALRFAALTLLGTVVVGAVLQLITGGFVQHMTFLSGLRWDSRYVLMNINGLGFDTVKSLLACILVILYRPRTPEERDAYLLLTIIFFFSLAATLFVCGFPGATSNHWITPALALSLLAALAAMRFAWAPAVLSIASVVMVPSMWSFMQSHTTMVKNGAAAVASRLERGALLMSEDPYWVLYTSSRPVIVDCTTFMNVWKNQPQAQQPLIEAIAARRYDEIMINEQDAGLGGSDIWSRQVVAAVESGYERVSQGIGNGRVQRLYKRRPSQAGSAEFDSKNRIAPSGASSEN